MIFSVALVKIRGRPVSVGSISTIRQQGGNSLKDYLTVTRHEENETGKLKTCRIRFARQKNS